MVVRSPFVHDGAAARLVKRLKYGAVTPVATLVAPLLAGQLPPSATALLPIPRTTLRRFRYGVDPALELASAVSQITGLPTLRALSPPVIAVRHAGRKRADRPSVHFHPTRPVDERSVLVDDVITTGLTLLSAARALGGSPRWAVTVTSAVEVTSLSARRPSAEFRSQGDSWTFS
jgi:predicted amidophosphoribosyltransferase